MNENIKHILSLLDNYENSNRYYSVKKDFSNPKYLNAEMCEKCKGICCISSGCLISPDDFNLKECFDNEKLNYNKAYNILLSEIKKGYISIEKIDGDTIYLTNHIIYILHIRDIDSPISVSLIKSKHSPCCLLTKTGCAFSYEDRPTGGKMLIPNFPQCHNDYDLRDCCREWLPFQPVLYDLYKFFKGHNTKCSV
jgi:hypothetical protein